MIKTVHVSGETGVIILIFHRFVNAFFSTTGLMTGAVFCAILCASAGKAETRTKPAGGRKPSGSPAHLESRIEITSSSKPFCNSVHKRDENRSERRRLSAVGAVGTPASGKSAGDTRRQCPVKPERSGFGMPKGRTCSAVPEESRSKRSFCRRSTDALPKGGNNPECRGVVPAGERPRSSYRPITG